MVCTSRFGNAAVFLWLQLVWDAKRSSGPNSGKDIFQTPQCAPHTSKLMCPWKPPRKRPLRRSLSCTLLVPLQSFSFVTAIRVTGANVFVWMEWMSEGFARDCQVNLRIDKMSLLRLAAEWRGDQWSICLWREKSEWWPPLLLLSSQRKVNGGHQALREKSMVATLWLMSRWHWDKRLVVRGLTGPKSLCVRLEGIGNINFSLWLTGGLSQGCPDFQKVYVFRVYVPFSCPILTLPSAPRNYRTENCLLEFF